MGDSLKECETGRGQTVVIGGGLASGKTELLQAFTEQVIQSGSTLLSATGAHAERALRMGVIGQLLFDVALQPDLADRLAKFASSESEPTGPGGAEEVGEAHPDRTVLRYADVRMVQSLTSALLGLANDNPLVILVDDIQFVDADSLQVLLSLRRRMRSARVLLVMTEWQRPSLARPLLRAEVTRQPQRRITLGPLSRAGVSDLFDQEGGLDSATGFVGRCFDVSGGNPLLLSALVEDQRSAGQPTDGRELTRAAASLDAAATGPVLGQSYRAAVLDCFHRWEPRFLRIAHGLAVLGRAADAELVSKLLVIRVHLVAEALDVFTAAGLLVDGNFRCDPVRTIVLDSLSAVEAAWLHLRAAELLYETGADTVEVARHLVVADAVPGPWAVRVLRQAADHSSGDDAELAAQSLELAMQACEHERDKLAFRVALVRLAWRANPTAVARHVKPLHDALCAGDLAYRDAVPIIRHLLWQGELAAATEQLTLAHTSAGPTDVWTLAELKISVGWLFGPAGERCCGELQTTLHAPERGGLASNPWLRAASSLSTMWSRGPTDEVVSSAEHILQGCLGEVAPEVGAVALLALVYGDRLRRATYWCDMLQDEAVRRRATTWQALVGAVRAEIAWRQGDLARASADGQSALALLHNQSWGILVALPLSVTVLANTAMGRHSRAAELLERPVPERLYESPLGARYLHASGHHQLATGRTLAALDDFERAAALSRKWGVDLPVALPWRSDLALAQLRLGRRKSARDLVTEQLERPASMLGVRARGVALRLQAASVELKDRVPLLRDAVSTLERSGDRLELARALTELGQAHRELGELGRARLVLRRAGQEAKECGAQLHTGQPPGRADQEARKPAKSSPPPATAGDNLSEAELKVAMLAAVGHTNREIGRKLYITVSTVEQHLTRVYRKLQVSRRTDLPSELSRHGVSAHAM
ncbi:AAA family ATPase [Natronosporangium hydrolyticum]|uniref:AAA family ATPase n=1 Tax=Natronosporangium hydrolyticum TaxID=2811111 RepID=A0A895YE10_9ACTN|nr:AAA family ATPase [Natronosporangium hydrolyticum]